MQSILWITAPSHQQRKKLLYLWSTHITMIIMMTVVVEGWKPCRRERKFIWFVWVTDTWSKFWSFLFPPQKDLVGVPSCRLVSTARRHSGHACHCHPCQCQPQLMKCLEVVLYSPKGKKWAENSETTEKDPCWSRMDLDTYCHTHSIHSMKTCTRFYIKWLVGWVSSLRVVAR